MESTRGKTTTLPSRRNSGTPLRRRILVVAVAAILGTACVQGRMIAETRDGNKIMSETEMNSGVTLTGKANVVDKTLTVEYTVNNSLSNSIYVFDEMIKYDASGLPLLDKTNAYVFWEEPSTLRLVRAVLRVPPNMNVYALEIPFAREVKTQSSISGKIVLSLPVHEYSPFAPTITEENVETVKCNSIVLFIGWTVMEAGTTVTETDAEGEQALRVRGSFRPFTLKASFPVETTLVKFKEGFDRQLPQHWEKSAAGR